MTLQDKLNKIRQETPEEVKLLINHSFALVDRIDEIMNRKNITQRMLADRLGKNESEVSKWMRGTHNFTLKTIAKLEAALGEPIISIATRRQSVFVFQVQNGKGTFNLAVKGIAGDLSNTPKDFYEDNTLDINQLCDQLN